MKSLVLSSGKVVPKVHSLDRLISELKNNKIDVSEIEQEAQQLDKFYISTRYPGQHGGPEGLYDEKDAQSATNAAEKILDFVRKRISESV